MRMGKSKRITTMGAALLAGALLTGCSNQIPEMTEEERTLVVNYAAEAVVRNDANYKGKLLSEGELQEIEAEEAEKKAREEAAQKAAEEAAQQSATSSTEAQEEESTETLDSMIAVEGIHFTYLGYELTESYPPAEDALAYFSMDATDGNELLVVHIEAKNETAADIALSMAERGMHFQIRTDSGRQSTLTTMLTNDLSNCEETIPAGESIELVLVGEEPAGSSVTQLSLIISNEEKTAAVTLE